jgi:hypothetical protein
VKILYTLTRKFYLFQPVRTAKIDLKLQPVVPPPGGASAPIGWLDLWTQGQHRAYTWRLDERIVVEELIM